MFHHLVEDCTVVPETSWLLNGKGLVCTCGRGLVCIRGKATRLYTRNVYGYAYRQKHKHTSYMLVCIYVYIQTCIPTYPFPHVPLTLRARVQINVSIPPHPNPKPTPLPMLKKLSVAHDMKGDEQVPWLRTDTRGSHDQKFIRI